MSKLITENDLKAIFDEVLPQPQLRDLLWTNPSPNDAFTAQDVMLSGAWDKYDYIEIEYKSSNTENTDYGAKIIERTPCHAGTVASVVAYNSAWYLRHRARWWNSAATGMHFDSAFYHNLESDTSHGQNDNVLIPYKIYGITTEKQILPIEKINSIVAEITNGIWKCRKWSNGEYECWCNVSESWAMTNTLGSVYYGQKSYDISSLEFSTIENIQVIGNCAAYYVATKIETYSTTSLTLTAMSAVSRTDTIKHFISIKGTWK